MRCSECNTQISPEGAPYCWNCGAPQHSSGDLRPMSRIYQTTKRRVLLALWDATT
jgi:predicted amidophosphoribosyltransferase